MVPYSDEALSVFQDTNGITRRAPRRHVPAYLAAGIAVGPPPDVSLVAVNEV